MDILAEALSKILNAEKVGKTQCRIGVSSNMIKNVLSIMKDNLYIGDFEEIKDGKGGNLIINLIGKINKAGVIKPRFSVKIQDYEKYEKRFLPAKDFGIIIMSTSKGLMIHTEAKKKKLGGKLISFVY